MTGVMIRCEPPAVSDVYRTVKSKHAASDSTPSFPKFININFAIYTAMINARLNATIDGNKQGLKIPCLQRRTLIQLVKTW